MFKLLDEICTLCPPSAASTAASTPADWSATFRTLGGRLPEELIQLNNRFGTGLFESRSSPINGSLIVYTSAVASYAVGRLAELRAAKLKRPNAFPASLYFEPGGLLPIGQVAAKLDVCYRTTGDNPDKWTVSLLRASTNDVDHLELTLLGFLHQLLTGAKPGSLLPEPAFPARKGFHWRPFGESVRA